MQGEKFCGKGAEGAGGYRFGTNKKPLFTNILTTRIFWFKPITIKTYNINFLSMQQYPTDSKCRHISSLELSLFSCSSNGGDRELLLPATAWGYWAKVVMNQLSILSLIKVEWDWRREEMDSRENSSGKLWFGTNWMNLLVSAVKFLYCPPMVGKLLL